MRNLVAGLTTLALMSIAAAPSAAATGAGSLDPTFGDGGKLIHNWVIGSDDDDIGGGIVQPDGKLVVNGVIPRGGSGASSILVARFLASGAPDPEFGNAGKTELALGNTAWADSASPALASDGRIFVVGGSSAFAGNSCNVAALLANGALDASFAGGGVFSYQVTAGISTSCHNIALQADGKLLVLGQSGSPATHFVLRLNANGGLDTTFGNQGIAAIPGAGNLIYGLDIAPNGGIYLAGSTATGARQGLVHLLTSTGSIDPSFATAGSYVTPYLNTAFNFARALPEGGVLLAGYSNSSKQVVAKLTAAGLADSGFGTAGKYEFSLGLGYAAVSLALQPDAKILAGLRIHTLPGPWRYTAARLSANGTLDASYADAGIAALDLGTPSEVLYGMALAPDGKLWLFGRSDLTTSDTALALARLLPDEITNPVVEFFNVNLNHYFITANPLEASAIDQGAAGPGWVRTGQSFRSGGPSKAARFYGNPATNPATGARRGPNSHFYSIDPAEIAYVKRDPGWLFESFEFNTWPKANGSCPSGTQAVMRVYNNRYAVNDSNHRYLTSTAIYQQMLDAGWLPEGTVFCAPQ